MGGEVSKRVFIRSWSEGEGVVPCPADKPVKAIAAIEDIDADTDGQNVVAAVSLEGVVVGATIKDIVSQVAQESVVPGLAKEDGVQASGIEIVIAATTVERKAVIDAVSCRRSRSP